MLTPRKQTMNDDGTASMPATPPVRTVTDNGQQDDGEEGLEDWEVDQDDQDFVSEYSGIGSAGNDGVLIVSGEDDDSNDESAADLSLLFRTAAALSLPGTDCSVPTDPGSIDVAFERGVSTNNLLEVPFSKHSTMVAMVDGSAQTEGQAPKIDLVKVIGSVGFVVMAVALALLAWDRNAWRALALSQQNELSLLKNELMVMNDHLALAKNASNAAMDILSLKNWRTQSKEESNANASANATEEMEWEQKDVKSTVLLADNCWFKAEANIKLGDCASNAKDGLGCVSSSVYQAFEGLGKAFWETAVFLKEGDANLVFNGKPLQAGITVDGLVEASNAIASATVAATDAMWSVVSQASQVMDDSILYAVGQTRDVIEDATYTMRYAADQTKFVINDAAYTIHQG
jgi:hypothetical protein